MKIFQLYILFFCFNFSNLQGANEDELDQKANPSLTPVTLDKNVEKPVNGLNDIGNTEDDFNNSKSDNQSHEILQADGVIKKISPKFNNLDVKEIIIKLDCCYKKNNDKTENIYRKNEKKYYLEFDKKNKQIEDERKESIESIVNKRTCREDKYRELLENKELEAKKRDKIIEEIESATCKNYEKKSTESLCCPDLENKTIRSYQDAEMAKDQASSDCVEACKKLTKAFISQSLETMGFDESQSYDTQLINVTSNVEYLKAYMKYIEKWCEESDQREISYRKERDEYRDKISRLLVEFVNNKKYIEENPFQEGSENNTITEASETFFSGLGMVKKLAIKNSNPHKKGVEKNTSSITSRKRVNTVYGLREIVPVKIVKSE